MLFELKVSTIPLLKLCLHIYSHCQQFFTGTVVLNCVYIFISNSNAFTLELLFSVFVYDSNEPTHHKNACGNWIYVWLSGVKHRCSLTGEQLQFLGALTITSNISNAMIKESTVITLNT